MNLFPWRVTLRRSAPCARTPFAARSRKTHRAQGALLRALLIVLVLAFAASATAQAIDPLPFKDHAQELRFQHLTAQLRCMVCQNETLADSNASLARDMRHEVFRLMQQGKTDVQIKQYLVDRYSDFVLYDPPVQPSTWLLWFGPVADPACRCRGGGGQRTQTQPCQCTRRNGIRRRGRRRARGYRA
ncbi:cytochrome C biogenesis protein ccmh [Rhodanobacter sp. 115]|nr:cytochrome C biogenesis protein ccmh [Rhodanobacter sp. 115]